MDNGTKKKVKAFIKDFGLQSVTLDSLRSVIKRQGYTIIEYNNIFNDENVTALIDALGLRSFCLGSKGFTYADSQYRLVFIHEALSEAEKLMVLAHEEGHIYCKHFSEAKIIGRDVIHEQEANEFAHYLLEQNAWQKIRNMVKKYRKASVAIIAVIALLIVSGVVAYNLYCKNTYFGEYYISSTGTKYHNSDCGYVKGKKNIERLTNEQYESGEYKPCGVCLPNG